jgi:hypothetical protein
LLKHKNLTIEEQEANWDWLVAFGFISQITYYLATWLFAWKYLMVAALMAHLKKTTKFNLTLHNCIKHAMVVLIIMVNICFFSVYRIKV